MADEVAFSDKELDGTTPHKSRQTSTSFAPADATAGATSPRKGSMRQGRRKSTGPGAPADGNIFLGDAGGLPRRQSESFDADSGSPSGRYRVGNARRMSVGPDDGSPSSARSSRRGTGRAGNGSKFGDTLMQSAKFAWQERILTPFMDIQPIDITNESAMRNRSVPAAKVRVMEGERDFVANPPGPGTHREELDQKPDPNNPSGLRQPALRKELMMRFNLPPRREKEYSGPAEPEHSNDWHWQMHTEDGRPWARLVFVGLLELTFWACLALGLFPIFTNNVVFEPAFMIMGAVWFLHCIVLAFMPLRKLIDNPLSVKEFLVNIQTMYAAYPALTVRSWSGEPRADGDKSYVYEFTDEVHTFHHDFWYNGTPRLDAADLDGDVHRVTVTTTFSFHDDETAERYVSLCRDLHERNAKEKGTQKGCESLRVPVLCRPKGSEVKPLAPEYSHGEFLVKSDESSGLCCGVAGYMFWVFGLLMVYMPFHAWFYCRFGSRVSVNVHKVVGCNSAPAAEGGPTGRSSGREDGSGRKKKDAVSPKKDVDDADAKDTTPGIDRAHPSYEASGNAFVAFQEDPSEEAASARDKNARSGGA